MAEPPMAERPGLAILRAEAPTEAVRKPQARGERRREVGLEGRPMVERLPGVAAQPAAVPRVGPRMEEVRMAERLRRPEPLPGARAPSVVRLLKAEAPRAARRVTELGPVVPHRRVVRLLRVGPRRAAPARPSNSRRS